MDTPEPIVSTDTRPLSDKQVVEVLGRNELVAVLMRAKIEVALPVRDSGVDLIAYAVIGNEHKFVARPIQLKASSEASFSIDRKYEKVPDLLIAFRSYVNDPKDVEIYALSYPEVVDIGDKLGWLANPSWTDKNRWMTNSPSLELRGLLARYRMTSEMWWPKIVGTRAEQA